MIKVNGESLEKGDGNQRDQEGYRSADGREAVEVESEEAEGLERGSVAEDVLISNRCQGGCCLIHTRKSSRNPLTRSQTAGALGPHRKSRKYAWFRVKFRGNEASAYRHKVVRTLMLFGTRTKTR